MTTYKIGQEVVVRKALGEKNGYAKGTYYHSGTLERVPLGAKAVIEQVVGSDKIDLKFKNNRYGNSGSWYVHPDEIGISQDEIKAQEEREKQKVSLLEQTLIADVPDAKQNGSKVSGRFEPKFNAREEFVLWMESQFPGITRGYVSLMPKILARKEEVYTAAQTACKHGIKTTDSCVQEQFREFLSDLKSSNRVSKTSQKSYDRDFCRYIHELVGLAKQVSGNLNSRNHWHYGTHLKES